MAAMPARDEPLELSLEDSEVVVLGPDGLSAALTLEAARETARRWRQLLSRTPGGLDDETYQKPLG